MMVRTVAGPPAMRMSGSVSPCPLWQLDFLRGDNLNGFCVTGSPRLEVNPLTGAPRGLLVEQATLNQATYGNDLSQWNLNGNAMLNHATVAPDGGTAYSLVMDAVWYSGVYRSLAGLTTGAPLTFSGYFKYVSGDATVLFGTDNTVFGGGSDTALLTFNCQTGAVVDASAGIAAHSVQAVGGGWYRAQLTATLATGTTSSILVFHGAGAVGENAAWGIQAEQAGGIATSLVTTGVDPVSRSASIVTVSGLAFTGFNPAEGTLLVEAEFEGLNGAINQPLLQVDDGSVSNRLLLGQSGGHLVATVTTGDSTVLGATILASPVAGTVYKIALGYANASFSACAGGGTVSTASSGGVPTGLTTLRLGNDGSAFADGWIRQVTYYPQKLPDADLKNLTV